MQNIKCARSPLSCWPSTVQSFSPATSLVLNPLQGKPFVLGYEYDQRESGHGMRPLACVSRHSKDALNRLEELIIPDQKSEQPILYDGSTKKQVDIDVLGWKNLFLFFSRLDIGDQVDCLYPVYEKLQEHKKGVIVWIPVEDKQWTERDQNTFEDLRTRKMPWYAIKCFPSSNYMKREWDFKGEPIVTVMDICGDVGPTVALPVIQEKGVEAFPFLA